MEGNYGEISQRGTVKNFRADELMEFYKSDLKLKKFLHIIENSQVYPVLYDRNRENNYCEEASHW
ncbi:hypothetical protein ACSBR2_036867 [Camellia fascicularis]